MDSDPGLMVKFCLQKMERYFFLGLHEDYAEEYAPGQVSNSQERTFGSSNYNKLFFTFALFYRTIFLFLGPDPEIKVNSDPISIRNTDSFPNHVSHGPFFIF